MMKQVKHLKKNADFQRVYRGGKSYANRTLILYMMENNKEQNRVGISVSKKVGNSVVRHHLTRLIREGCRLHRECLPEGCDLIFVVRPAAKNLPFAEIERSIQHVAGLTRKKT